MAWQASPVNVAGATHNWLSTPYGREDIEHEAARAYGTLGTATVTQEDCPCLLS